MAFSDTIKNLRLSKNMSQEEFANALNLFAEKSDGLYSSNFNKTNISKWETGKVEPRMDTIRLIASTFDISPNELMELEDTKPYYTLNDKDEKDIAKTLEKMIENLDGLRYSKEESEYSDETRELLIGALEQAARIAKMEAKRKYTPKKYRNEE